MQAKILEAFQKAVFDDGRVVRVVIVDGDARTDGGRARTSGDDAGIVDAAFAL